MSKKLLALLISILMMLTPVVAGFASDEPIDELPTPEVVETEPETVPEPEVEPEPEPEPEEVPELEPVFEGEVIPRVIGTITFTENPAADPVVPITSLEKVKGDASITVKLKLGGGYAETANLPTNYVWESSDDDVVGIATSGSLDEEATLSFVGPGTATISVEIENYEKRFRDTASFTVTVTETPYVFSASDYKLTITGDTWVETAGDANEKVLTAALTLADGADPKATLPASFTLTWASSVVTNATITPVVETETAKVKGLAVGSTSITVTATWGEGGANVVSSAAFAVNVLNLYAFVANDFVVTVTGETGRNWLETTGDNATLQLSAAVSLADNPTDPRSANYLPETGAATVVWSSNDPGGAGSETHIAVSADGLVTAISETVTPVTVTATVSWTANSVAGTQSGILPISVLGTYAFSLSDYEVIVTLDPAKNWGWIYEDDTLAMSAELKLKSDADPRAEMPASYTVAWTEDSSGATATIAAATDTKNATAEGVAAGTTNITATVTGPADAPWSSATLAATPVLLTVEGPYTFDDTDYKVVVTSTKTTLISSDKIDTARVSAKIELATANPTAEDLYTYPELKDTVLEWTAAGEVVVSTNGIVRPVSFYSVGVGTVTATFTGGDIPQGIPLTGSTTIDVEYKRATPVDFVLSRTSVVLPKGEDAWISAKSIPDLQGITYTWKITGGSDPSSIAWIADRSNDYVLIQANDAGEVTLECTYGELKRTCKITVVDEEVKSISLTAPEDHVAIGGTLVVTAVVETSNWSAGPYAGSLVWSVSDKSVATIEPVTGTLTANLTGEKAGYVMVTAVAPNGVMDEYLVLVHKTPTAGAEIVETEEDLTLYKDDEVQLRVEYADGEYPTGTVLWSGSTADVTVTPTGYLVALDPTASPVQITATLNGKTAKWNVTVKPYTTSATIDKPAAEYLNGSFYLKKKETKQLAVTGATPSGTDDMWWWSDNPKVATVDGEGKVTAVGEGTANITLLNWRGDELDFVTVTVWKNVSSIKFGAKSVAVDVNLVTPYNLADLVKMTVSPVNTNAKLTYTSDDPLVVSFANQYDSEFTARKYGKAKVTVKSDNGKQATIDIIVNPAVFTLNGFASNSTSAVKVEDTVTLVAALEQPLGTTQTIDWSTSSAKIATVANGVVTGVKAGKATITATAHDSGQKLSCVVTVYKNAATEAKITKQSAKLTVGKTLKPAVTFTPKGSYKQLTWESSDETVATVDPFTGLITARDKGKAKITARDNTGVLPLTDTAGCIIEVEVESKAISVELLDPNAYSDGDDTDWRSAVTWLAVPGMSTQLMARSYPELDDGQKFTWSTSNKKVSVDAAGKVTVPATFTGSVTITVKAPNGKKATCKVTVVNPVRRLELNQHEVYLAMGKTLTLKVTKYDEKGKKTSSKEPVIWNLDGAGLEPQKAAGKFKAVKPYEWDVVSVETQLGGLEDRCEVITIIPAKSVALPSAQKKITIDAGQSFQLEPKFTASSDGIYFDGIVSWTTNKSGIAIVSEQGLIVGLKAGKATITGKSAGGKKVTCAVTVK